MSTTRVKCNSCSKPINPTSCRSHLDKVHAMQSNLPDDRLTSIYFSAAGITGKSMTKKYNAPLKKPSQIKNLKKRAKHEKRLVGRKKMLLLEKPVWDDLEQKKDINWTGLITHGGIGRSR